MQVEDSLLKVGEMGTSHKRHIKNFLKIYKNLMKKFKNLEVFNKN